MVQKPKNFVAYQADILAALAQTGIRQLSPGGKARAFGDIVASKIGEQEAGQFLNLAETLLPFATGSNLDLAGEIRGVYRIPQQSASVDSADSNFKFYVRRGKFGDINNGQDISIPADVRITGAADNGPVYLANAVLLPADASEVYFGVRSFYPGAGGNAAAKVISRHNFTNYTESLYGSLLVTNMYGVVGGRDEEDDESYRFRIYQKIRSRAGANEAALRFELLQIPGIQDVAFAPHAGGYTVYVYSITPQVAASLLDAVQARINDVTAFPITGAAVAPDLAGISLATTAKLAGAATQVDQSMILNRAASAAADYINNLRIGEPLVVNEIADRMRNADSRILDLGEPNRQIREIYIWRSRNDGTRYSRTLVGNYQPVTGERIVVEDRVNAVSLAVA